MAKSDSPDKPCPIVIFTRPTDVYQSQRWLATIALENAFTVIYDFMIMKDHVNGLDKVILSSQEGLYVIWYSEKTWHLRPFRCNSSEPSNPATRLIPVKSKSDDIKLIVALEVVRNVLLLCIVLSPLCRNPEIPYYPHTFYPKTIMNKTQ